MTVWIDEPLALAIHDRQVAEHGGRDGIRDEGLLRSALARPEQLLAYADPSPDLAGLAAKLAFGLARNHPFIDGNKRTAYACCLTFLALNGSRIECEPDEKYLRFLAMAEGGLDLPGSEAWIRSRLVVSN